MVGQAAPRFNLPSSTGDNVKLADYAGKSRVVLYFYPRADTPGCTKEACGFRDAIAGYKKLNVPVFGISPDPVEDVTMFATKFKLNFPLLADTDGAVGRAYGVLGGDGIVNKLKTAAGLADRVTFIIDENGIITHIIDKPDVEHHADEVLALL